MQISDVVQEREGQSGVHFWISISEYVRNRIPDFV